MKTTITMNTNMPNNTNVSNITDVNALCKNKIRSTTLPIIFSATIVVLFAFALFIPSTFAKDFLPSITLNTNANIVESGVQLNAFGISFGSATLKTITFVEDSKKTLFNWDCAGLKACRAIKTITHDAITNETHTYQALIIDKNNNRVWSAVKTVTFVGPNKGPSITSIPSININEDSGFNDTLLNFENFVNDPDTTKSTLNYEIISQSNPGLVQCSITQIHNLNCTTMRKNGYGTSTISVRVADAFDDAQQDIVVNVANVNDAPIVIGNFANATIPFEGGTKASQTDVLNVFNDPDSTLNYTFIVTPANAGTASLINDSHMFFTGKEFLVQLKGAQYFHGTVTVTVIANDSEYTANSTVYFSIADTPDAPVLNGTNVFLTQEETPIQLNATKMFFDPDDVSAPLKFSSILQKNSNITINEVEGLLGGYTITPIKDFFGNATFSIKVTDATNLSTSQAITIIVTNVNDAPVFNTSKLLPSNVTFPEDSVGTLNLSGIFYDIDNPTLTYIVANSTQNLTLSINNSNGIVTIIPEPDFYGTRTAYFFATDGELNSTLSNAVLINFTSVPDNIKAINGTISVFEDINTTVNVTQFFSNPDNIPVIYKFISSNRPEVTLQNFTIDSDGMITVVPQKDFSGEAIFQFNATATKNFADNSANNFANIPVFSNVTVNVIPVNDAPVINSSYFSNILNFTNMPEDSSNVALSLFAGATDIDNAPSDINWSCKSETANSNIVLFMDNTTKNLSINATNNINGAFQIACRAFDGNLSSRDVGVFTLNITPVNDAPIFTNIPAVLESFLNRAFLFTIKATDVDSNKLTFAINDTDTFTLNDTTGIINFTPTTVNNYSVNATVCDDSNSLNNCTSEVFTIFVSNVSFSEIVNSQFNGTLYSLLSTPNFTGIIGSNITNTIVWPDWSVIRSIIENSTLNNSALESSNVKNSTAQNSIITRCIVKDSLIKNYNATDCVINNAVVDPAVTSRSLNNATVTNSTIFETDVINSILTGANINNGTIAEAIITNAVLNNTAVINSIVDNTTIFGANLTDANVTNGILINGMITTVAGVYNASLTGSVNLSDVANYPPTVSVSALPVSTAQTNQNVIFTAVVSDLNIGSQLNDSVNVSWQFSDGVNLSGTVVSRTFTNAGTYTATAIAQDKFNETSSPAVLSITITLPPAPAPSNNGGGSSGGNSGSGGGISPIVSISVSETPSTMTLALGQIATFNFKGTQHSVAIGTIVNNSTTITVSSSPITKTFNVGETVMFDLDADNIYDIEVTLRRVAPPNFADFTFKVINVPVTQQPPSIQPPTVVTPPAPQPQINVTPASSKNVTITTGNEINGNKISKTSAFLTGAFTAIVPALTSDIGVGVGLGVAIFAIVLGLALLWRKNAENENETFIYKN